MPALGAAEHAIYELISEGFLFCQVEFVADGTDLRLQSALLEPARILAFARMLEPVVQT